MRSPACIACNGRYLSLKLVWLKFVLLWRFFRLWAMLDGRDPPENLPRCMSTHYSALSFWRTWHASLSLWLLKYLYLPLGGRHHRMRNLAVTFGFVAAWHGLEARMFGWAALVLLSLAPEVLASQLLLEAPPAASSTSATTPARGEKGRGSSLRHKWYYEHLVAAGGATSIGGLIIANLAGFGSSGMAAVRAALETDARDDVGGTLRTVGGAWALLFVGVHLMRDLERWRSRRAPAGLYWLALELLGEEQQAAKATRGR